MLLESRVLMMLALAVDLIRPMVGWNANLRWVATLGSRAWV